jgi:hypothetical protein
VYPVVVLGVSSLYYDARIAISFFTVARLHLNFDSQIGISCTFIERQEVGRRSLRARNNTCGVLGPVTIDKAPFIAVNVQLGTLFIVSTRQGGLQRNQ